MKFRRKEARDPVVPDGVEAPEEATEPNEQSSRSAEERPEGVRAGGPWDASEVTLDEDDETKIRLGGLIVTGRPGVDLRLQVDEASSQVTAVLLVGAEGAVEARPFAAPRTTDIWDDIRRRIAAETARRGGTASEAIGEWGKELRVVIPLTTPEGRPGTQTSRVVGIPGPRWLLRATFLGKPATDFDPDADVEKALRDLVVVRGSEAMAPGEPLPLVMPANAQLIQPPG